VGTDETARGDVHADEYFVGISSDGEAIDATRELVDAALHTRDGKAQRVDCTYSVCPHAEKLNLFQISAATWQNNNERSSPDEFPVCLARNTPVSDWSFPYGGQ